MTARNTTAAENEQPQCALCQRGIILCKKWRRRSFKVDRDRLSMQQHTTSRRFFRMQRCSRKKEELTGKQFVFN
jgi:hypothetical protein